MIAKHKPQIQPAADALVHMVHQHSPEKVTKFTERIRRFIAPYSAGFKAWLLRHHLGVEAGLMCAGLGFILFSVFWQRQLFFGFSSTTTCNGKFVILPDLHQVTNDGGYDVSFEKKLSIGSLDLLSRRFCVTPRVVQPPNSVETLQFSPLGLGLIEHSVNVKVPEYPKIDTRIFESKLAVGDSLVLPILTKDTLFSYRISANNKDSQCTNSSLEITCPLEGLELKQATTYEAEVTRIYNKQQVEVVFKGQVQTTEPVVINASAPANGEIVYANINEIRLDTNKEIKTSTNVRLYAISGETQNEVESNIRIEGASLFMTSTDPLPRRASFKLVVENIKAADGGQLDGPFEIQFHTSGGPVVIGANVKAQGVNLGTVLSISFDQPLSTQQNAQSLVSLSSAGVQVPVNARISGSRIYITPSSLERCTTYKISVSRDVASQSGANGDSAWSYSFRTTCAQVSVIGRSVNGRAIYAYKFGSGASSIVFVGAMHGTEASSYYTLNAWIDELERHPERIPAGRSVIVIPNSNPDGLAKRQRTNANGVDLNRNFPASDWTPDVYMPGPTFVAQGGGSAPLSEPESSALAGYINSLAPRLVLTYHAVAGVVIGNGSGDSDALASLYASKSKYAFATDSQADDVFSYPTTGEFEDWLHDKKGIPALLVELATVSSNEFIRNKDALWAMVEL